MGSYPEDEAAMMWTALREGAGIRIVAMTSAEDAELASHIMAITTYLETERLEASDTPLPDHEGWGSIGPSSQVAWLQ